MQPAFSPLALITTFVVQTIVLSGGGLAAQVWLRRRIGREISRGEALVIGALAPTLLGYAAFWIYFASPLAGRYFSFGVVAAVLVTLARAFRPRWGWLSVPAWVRSASARSAANHGPAAAAASGLVLNGRLLALTLAAGVLYLAALAMYPGPKFTETAGARFIPKMPGDNEIPRIFAERLYIGMSTKVIGGDWLSSDRPPLQTGIALLAMPLLRAAGVNIDLICGAAGVWFQLLWIPAVWLFLRWLGLKEHEAHGATAALTFTGFLLFNSVFVWPKLGAAALVLMAFVVLFDDGREICSGGDRARFGSAGALVALGTLAHGGVMFSLLALGPFALRRCWHHRGATLAAAAIFFALTLPWTAYQKFHAPPGDRLIKWHLAGQIPPDARSVLTTLRENYRELGWTRAVEARKINFAALFYGEWRDLLTPRAGEIGLFRRYNEAPWTFRTLAVWILGLAAVVGLAVRAWRSATKAATSRRTPKAAARATTSSERRDSVLECGDLSPPSPARTGCAHASIANDATWRGFGRRHALAAAWTALTLILWATLMFLPRQTLVHQGSLVTQLVLLALLAASLVLCGKWVFAVVAAAQAWLFLLTWLPPTAVLAWPVHIGAGVACVAMAGVIGGMAVTSWRAKIDEVDQVSDLTPNDGRVGGQVKDLTYSPRHWWRAPRLTPWVLAALALLLFLRKPHALHTPQLYAEDGTIFLAFNDLLGLRAFFEPYMGYLHLLPRLIAWAASRLLDPLWWPAFYNGASFLIWVAVLARMFSPRLQLPGKPWLALAFIIGPQSGEILFNITNLQWVCAFLLVQQALIARPVTPAQRIGDLVIVMLVGLTGPFVIALGPLLAWRWWRDRNGDNLAVLLVATACAAVQAWFVLPTGPKFDFPQFDAIAFLQNVGQRILIWPVAGEALMNKLPRLLVGIAGVGGVAALLAWALRPHPRRGLRGPVVAAFAFMMAAMVYRSRPDTWNYENLVFSDRYYYIPRVLLAWLLVWEFDAVPRALAWLARALFLAIAVMHLHTYIVPPPPNYDWPKHVDPIRRGVPAEIPTLPEGWTLEYRGRKQ